MQKLISYLKVGQAKGTPRIWIQSRRLSAAGFDVGQSYSVDVSPDDFQITLRADATGPRIVSRKKKGDDQVPVIDLNNKTLSEIIPGSVERVRVSVSDGVIEVTLHPDDKRAVERLARLKEKLEKGAPLATGEICAGGGIMADAMHRGFKDSGVNTRLSLAVEKESDYLDQLLKNHKLVSSDTVVVEGGMEEVDLDALPLLEVLSSGIPCLGASQAGRTRNKLAAAEEHSSVGNLFVPFLAIVKKTNPAIVLLENVPQWASTVSQHVIRTTLAGWGYDIHETRLDRSLGAFEDRKRFCMVAVTKGVEFDWDRLLPVAPVPASLGQLMDDVPLDSPRWNAVPYLFEKAKKDKAAGKGFAMNIVDETASRVLTIPANYWKWQSTGTLIQHPEDPSLFRLLTPAEHARCKGVPVSLIEGLSDTKAHQILGQSVLHPAFRAVARLIGESILALKSLVPAFDEAVEISHDEQPLAQLSSSSMTTGVKGQIALAL
jgi:DNA (cytosine-5)-methyltransferase 1